MSRYRFNLPQMKGKFFITDGGLETTLIFENGLALPEFAAFPLVDDVSGRQVLGAYYSAYIDLAREHRIGAVLETATWRASHDWARRLGFDLARLPEINRKAVELIEDLRGEGGEESPIIISGNIGPRGDGYRADVRMSIQEAMNYHYLQISDFASSAADMVSAFTLNYVEEAIGITLAAQDRRVPLVVSFTVETDGVLPSGTGLREAIEYVDEVTGGYPLYYMINCAHSSHYDWLLRDEGSWKRRILGVRSNASRLSHAELDCCETLDEGNPVEFGIDHAWLHQQYPWISIIGGCCGTSVGHVAAVAKAVIGP